MEHTFWVALGASLLAATVTTLGIYTIRRYTVWGQKNSIYFVCFAAGVLISVSFLHIIPKAFSMNPNAPIFLLIGFLLPQSTKVKEKFFSKFKLKIVSKAY